MGETKTINVGEDGTAAGVKPPARGEATSELFERAKKGDQSCLPEVRALLAEPERGPSLIESLGSSAEWLRQGLAKRAAGGSLIVQEAVLQKMEKLRTGLAGPNPTPIERLLAERAALCWFIVNHEEERFLGASSMTLAQADYNQRKIDRAHRRFLTAVETLARVRKLAVPSLMLNIAKNQQLNVNTDPKH